MRKLFLSICLFILVILLYGCKDNKEDISSIEINNDVLDFDENFKLSDINVKVYKKDGSSTYIPLNESMISKDDLSKLSLEGTHTINVNYLNQSTSFTITIKGEKGDNGHEVLLQVANGYIQWKYDHEETWTNLISLSDITGLTGQNGTNGKEVTFQIAEGYIQWKYVDDSTWNNLLSLSSLKGSDGLTPTISISDDGFWIINGIKTDKRAVIETIEIPKHTITFELNGGEMTEEPFITNVTKGDAITLPIPNKRFYIFKGWYTGNTVNDIQFGNYTPVVKDVKLYAKWEEDPKAISTFLNLVTTNNLTMNTLSNNIFTYLTLDLVESGSREETIKVFENDSIINNYYLLNQTTYENDVITLTDHIEDYSIYQNNTKYSLTNTNNTITFDMNNLTYKNKYDFNKFNINKFDQVGDSLIYQYPVDNNVCLFFGFDIYLFDEQYLPALGEIGTCEFDLLNMKVTLNLFIHDIIYFNSEISFSDIGTTDFEFPIENVKTVVNKYIDDRIASIEDINYATTASLDVFNNMVNGFKLYINNSISVDELTIYYQNCLSSINQYSFEIDQLKQYKYNKIKDLKAHFDELYQTATINSKEQMQLIYDSYITVINSSHTYEEVDIEYNNAIINLDNAYIFNESLIIDSIKDEAMNKIFNLIYINNGVLQNESDKVYFNDVFDLYRPQIENAPTILEVNNIYEQAYQALVVLNYPYNQENYINYKVKSVYDLKDYFNGYERMLYIKFSQNVYDTYEYHKNLINASSNVIEIEKLLENGYNALKNALIPELKIAIQNQLTNAYNTNAYIVVSNELSNLNNIYNISQQKLIDAGTIEELFATIEYFNNSCNSLDVDNLKFNINLGIFSFESEFYSLSKFATDSSINAMEVIFNDYIILLKACTTQDDFEFTINNAFSQLNNAYEIDLVKQEVEDERLELFQKMIDYRDYTLSLLDYVNESMIIDDLNLKYYDLFNNALTIDELNNLYDQWYNEFLNLPITIDSILLANQKDIYLSELQEIYNFIVMHINDYSEEVDINYNAGINLITASTNHLNIYNDYHNLLSYLNDYSLNTYKPQVLDEMLEKYNYYRLIIYDTDLPYLAQIHSFYAGIIYDALDVYVIKDALYDFNNECHLLSVDSFKLNKYNYIQSYKNQYDELVLTATVESIEQMTIVLNTYITNIENTTNPSDLYNMYTEGLNALYNVYIPLENL